MSIKSHSLLLYRAAPSHSSVHLPKWHSHYWASPVWTGSLHNDHRNRCTSKKLHLMLTHWCLFHNSDNHREYAYGIENNSISSPPNSWRGVIPEFSLSMIWSMPQDASKAFSWRWYSRLRCFPRDSSFCSQQWLVIPPLTSSKMQQVTHYWPTSSGWPIAVHAWLPIPVMLQAIDFVNHQTAWKVIYT